MIIIGLTGSIGMGKSTVANLFASHGIPVCSADAIVHRLMEKGGKAVDEVGTQFPGVVENGAVNRKRLGEIVFAEPAKRKTLEAILHPLVVAEEEAFAAEQAHNGADMVVLEIPLLFETGANKRCDVVVVVSAPAFIQRRRVMKRPHMTKEKFAAILKAQMPDRLKRQKADAVIPTGLGLACSTRAVARLVARLRKEKP
ncbi:MAG: dephospho-CoA kinase [Rickettsiales bacterium]|nr:dephospho-CoA kinase [Rickettsiales bacterium]